MKKNLFFIAAVTAAVFAFSSCSNLFEQFMNEDESDKTGDDTLSVGKNGTDEVSRRSIIDAGLVVIKSTEPSVNQIAYLSSQNTYYVGENATLSSDYTNGTKACITNKDETVIIKTVPNDKNAKVIAWSVLRTYSSTWNDTTKIDEVSELKDYETVPYSIEDESDNEVISISADNLPYGTTKVTSTVSADDSYYQAVYTVYLTKKHSGVTLLSSSNKTIDSGLVVIKQTAKTTNQITFTSGQNDYYVGKNSNITSASYINGSEICLNKSDDSEFFKCYLPDKNSAVTWTAKQIYKDVVTSKTSTTLTTGTLPNGGTYQYYPTEMVETLTKLDTETDCTAKIIKTDSDGNTQTPDSYGQFMIITLPYGTTVVTATVNTDDNEYRNVYTITLTKLHKITDENGDTQIDDVATISGLTVKPINQTSDDSSTSNSLSPAFDSTTFIYTYTADSNTDALNLSLTNGNDATVTVTEKIKGGDPVSVPDYSSIPIAGGQYTEIDITVEQDGILHTYYIFVDKTNDGNTALATLGDEVTSATTGGSATASSGITSFTLSTTDQGRTYAASAFSAEATGASGIYEIKASADNRVDVNQITFTATPSAKYTTLDYYIATGNDDITPSKSLLWTTLYKYVNSSTITNASAVMTLSNSEAINYNVIWIRATTKAYYHTLADISNGKGKYADVAYHRLTVTKFGEGKYALTSFYGCVGYEAGIKTTSYTTYNTVINDSLSSTIANVIDPTIILTQSKLSTYADSLTFYFRTVDKDSSGKLSVSAVNDAYNDGDTNTTGDQTFDSTDTTKAYLSGITETTKTTDFTSDGLSYYTFTIGKADSNADYPKQDLPDGKTTITVTQGSTPIATITVTKPTPASVDLSVSGDNNRGYDSKDESYKIYVGSAVTTEPIYIRTYNSDVKVSITSCTNTYTGDYSASDTTLKGTKVTENNTVPFKLEALEWAGSTQPSSSTGSTAVTGATVYKLEVGNGTTNLPTGTTAIPLVLTSADGNTTRNFTVYIIKLANTEARLSALSFSTGGTKDSSSPTWSKDTASDTKYTFTGTGTDSSEISATPFDSKATVKIDYIVVSDKAATLASDVTALDWNTPQTSTVLGAAGSATAYITGSLSGKRFVYARITCTAEDGTTTRVYYVTRTVVYEAVCTLASLNVTQALSSAASSVTATLLNQTGIAAGSVYAFDTNPTYARYTYNLVYTPALTSTKSTISSTTVSYSADGSSYTGLTDTNLSSNSITVSNGVVTVPYAYYSTVKYLKVTYVVLAEDAVSSKTYTVSTKINSWVTATTESEPTQGSHTYIQYVPADSLAHTKLMAYRFGSYRTDGQYRYISGTQEYEGIDIIGSYDSGANWGATAYLLSGWLYCVNIDGTTTWLKLDSTGSATYGDITLKVVPTVRYDGSAEDATPYLTLAFTVTNKGTSAHTVKLGAMIDTFVDTVTNANNVSNAKGQSDAVNITVTSYGFYMLNGGYKFDVYTKNTTGVDDVSYLWYGAYNSEDDHVFDSTSPDVSPSDSAVSYSWTLGSMAASSSSTKSIMMSLSNN